MLQLHIEGMTCAHCARSVKEALEAVPGVESAEVNLADGKAIVQGTAERRVLVAAVEEEGYRVSP